MNRNREIQCVTQSWARFRKIANRAALLALAALAAGSAQAQTTYTWANANITATPTSPLDWFGGGPNTQASWTGGTPSSGSANTIQFFQDTSTALLNTGASGNTQTANINNGGSAFQLGTLTLNGKASATTGANLAETLSGDPLNFSAATGTINLNGVNNTRTLTYNLNSNIQLGTAGSSSALTITGNGTGAFNIGGIISELQAGGGSLIKSGSSAVTLSGANSYTGGTVIDGGRLQFNAGAVPATGQITINAAGVLAASGAYTTAANWLGSGKIATGSAGVLALTANNGANIDFSTGGYNNLYLGATGAFTFGNYTLTPGANGYLLGGGGGTLTLGNAGKMGAGKNLTVGGNVTLSAANTSFNGTVTVNAGTLTLGNTSALGSATAITLAGGTVLASSVNGVVIDAPITLGVSGSTVTINATAALTLTLNKAISGAGNLTLASEAGSNAFVTNILGVASSYQGSTLFTCGASAANLFVKLGAADALPTTTVLTLDGGDGAGSGRTVQLDLNGHNQTLAGLTNITRSLRNQQIVNTSATAATLTVTNASDGTFSGKLGTGSADYNFGLTKGGAGTLTLSGANSYSGDTTVNAGTLKCSYANASNELSTVTIAATGATLQLDFSGTDTVDKLFIGTTQMKAGVYGTNNVVNIVIPQITGKGTLTVTSSGKPLGTLIRFF